MPRLLVVIPSLVLLVACGGGSTPTAPAPVPTPTPTPAATRIIDVTSELAFGDVEVGGSVTLGFRIRNTGTAPLTVTGLTFSTHDAVFTTKFTFPYTVSGGDSQAVFPQLTFAPIAVQSYTGVLTVNGDQTSGNDRMDYSGIGTPPTPVWALSGSGDKVFDMPAKVRNYLLTADYSGDRAEFTYYHGETQQVVRVLGTTTGLTHLEIQGVKNPERGTQVEVRSSAGVNWSFTERKQAWW